MPGSLSDREVAGVVQARFGARKITVPCSQAIRFGQASYHVADTSISVW